MQVHPLAVILFVTSILAVIFFIVKNPAFLDDRRKRTYILIAIFHPVFVYIIFHAVLGFSILPRYSILLTMALAFSSVLLISELEHRLIFPATLLGGLIFSVIGAHSLLLYWRPSSESELLRVIMEKYNSADSVFVIEKPALRLSLPMNSRSLTLLDDRRKNMERFKFLSGYPELVDRQVTFKPATVTVYNDTELKTTLENLSTGTSSVWTITTDCTASCTASETREGTCFSLHTKHCGRVPQEPDTLNAFLSYDQLGYSYFVHKVH